MLEQDEAAINHRVRAMIEQVDKDGDGCHDFEEDLDDDNDGVDDELESDCDTDPLDAESVPTLNDDGSCKDSASSLEDDDGGFITRSPHLRLLQPTIRNSVSAILRQCFSPLLFFLRTQGK